MIVVLCPRIKRLDIWPTQLSYYAVLYDVTMNYVLIHAIHAAEKDLPKCKVYGDEMLVSVFEAATWWRHQIKGFSASLALCAVNV